MQKKFKIERRRYSRIKPFFYLLLQVILVWEFFWIVTGEATLGSWSYFELTLCAIMISYLSIKTLRVLKRTAKENQWSEKIKMEKFLNL